MIDNYERRHVREIDLNEEIEEFNDKVEKRIDRNEKAEGMNEEVEKEQIDMGEELNEDSDGSNNTDKVPDPCVGMYITPYYKWRILNNDAAGRENHECQHNGKTSKCDKAILVEEVFHKAYTNSKFKEVQEEVHGLMHTNANKCGGDKVYGGRRLQVLEKNGSNSTLKDPPDRRRKGRAPAK
ncbi:hypothetical protein Cgig2_003646 [Carnegiea gigantea]|uniref:Uncharacterized protein n=1 Tax=Carnegiea gigantea TaxID=171969 RepID=A0A9Q1GSK8_9CARY|nr:hypothetical protein Cgig2_003646 [Carnegiea gigantea]